MQPKCKGHFAMDNAAKDHVAHAVFKNGKRESGVISHGLRIDTDNICKPGRVEIVPIADLRPNTTVDIDGQQVPVENNGGYSEIDLFLSKGNKLWARSALNCRQTCGVCEIEPPE